MCLDCRKRWKSRFMIDKAFSSYSRVGVGRDDGKAEGEFSPVYLIQVNSKALSSGTFWFRKHRCSR